MACFFYHPHANYFFLCYLQSRNMREAFKRGSNEAAKFERAQVARAEDQSRTRPSCVDRFLRRLRDKLSASIHIKGEKEERLLRNALEKYARLDGSLNAVELTRALVKDLGVHVSPATADATVAYVRQLYGGAAGNNSNNNNNNNNNKESGRSTAGPATNSGRKSEEGNGDGGPRMNSEAFVRLALAELVGPKSSDLGTIMTYPTSSRVAQNRLNAHQDWMANRHLFRSAIDTAPESVRRAPVRPPLIDAFVGEVQRTIDASAGKSRLGFGSEAAATETNLARLLGQHSDLVRGARINTNGVSAPKLCLALTKLGLDLPLPHARTIVNYYADLAAAEGGPLLSHDSNEPSKSTAMVPSTSRAAATGNRSSNSRNGTGLSLGSSSERLMPYTRLVAEVNHNRPDALAQYGPAPPTEGALAAAEALGMTISSNSSNGGSNNGGSNSKTTSDGKRVFRAPVSLLPRREVEAVRTLLRDKATAIAFANGGTASSLLRACLLDCVDLSGGVAGRQLAISVRRVLKCPEITLAQCEALVAYYAEAHAVEQKNRLQSRGAAPSSFTTSSSALQATAPSAALDAPKAFGRSNSNRGGSATAASSGSSSQVNAEESSQVYSNVKVPLNTLLAGLGGDLEAGGKGALNIGAGNFLVHHEEPTAPPTVLNNKGATTSAASGLLGSSTGGGNNNKSSTASTSHGGGGPVPREVEVSLGKLALAALDASLKQSGGGNSSHHPVDALEGACLRFCIAPSQAAAAMRAPPLAFPNQSSSGERKKPPLKNWDGSWRGPPPSQQPQHGAYAPTTFLSKRRFGKLLRALKVSGNSGGGGGGSSGGSTHGLSDVQSEAVFAWYAVTCANGEPPLLDYRPLIRDVATVLEKNAQDATAAATNAARYHKQSSQPSNTGSGARAGPVGEIASPRSTLVGDGFNNSGVMTALPPPSARGGSAAGSSRLGTARSGASPSSSLFGLHSGRPSTAPSSARSSHLTRRIEQRANQSNSRTSSASNNRAPLVSPLATKTRVAPPF